MYCRNSCYISHFTKSCHEVNTLNQKTNKLRVYLKLFHKWILVWLLHSRVVCDKPHCRTCVCDAPTVQYLLGDLPRCGSHLDKKPPWMQSPWQPHVADEKPRDARGCSSPRAPPPTGSPPSAPAQQHPQHDGAFLIPSSRSNMSPTDPSLKAGV